MPHHLMQEEDKPLCGNPDNNGPLTFREDVADCPACWRIYAASLREQAAVLRDTNGRLALERDDALNNRLPPEVKRQGGNPPWTATQTANYWGNQARQLEEKAKSLTERLDEACMRSVAANQKLAEMEAAYKVLLQHLKAGHDDVQCRLCHPALVERDEAVLKLATLTGGLKALLENPDGQ